MRRTSFTILIFLISLQLFAQKQTEPVYPGMSVQAFEKVYPQFVPEIPTERFTIDDNIAGLDGTWKITFNADTIQASHFSSIFTFPLNAEVRTGFFKKAEEISKRFGAPVEQFIDSDAFYRGIQRRDAKFIPVIIYSWLTRHSKVVLAMRFSGNSPMQSLAGDAQKKTSDFHVFQLQILNETHPDLNTDWDFYTGMSRKQFNARFPEYAGGLGGIHSIWVRKDTVNSLAGEWHYSFGQSRLQGFTFETGGESHGKQGRINAIQTAESLADYYTSLWGKPKTRKKLVYEEWATDFSRNMEIAEWDKGEYTVKISMQANIQKTKQEIFSFVSCWLKE